MSKHYLENSRRKRYYIYYIFTLSTILLYLYNKIPSLIISFLSQEIPLHILLGQIC